MTERNKIVPASYLFVTKNNKILLLRRYNTGYEDGKYSMVAGHVDEGESFIDCMLREAFEEAGIIIKKEDLEMIHTLHRNCGPYNERIDIFFKVKKWEGELINKEPNKCDDLSWFDLDNIPENTIFYIKHVINSIKKGLFYSEIGWEK